MAYNASSKTLYGAASASDIVNLINDEIPKYFDNRIVYWRNNAPKHWPAGWANKLSATKNPPRMSVPTNMKGHAVSYASFLASLDQMFKIWSMVRNITYQHTTNRDTNGGHPYSTHTDGSAKAFLTENSYSISGRDADYKLSGRPMQNSYIKSLLNKLKIDIDNAPAIVYSYSDPCHHNCHNSCHGSGGFR